MNRFFTSESVTEGHPDKVSDRISDAILDAHLKEDPMTRSACEVAVTTNFVLVMGEITSTAKVDIEKIVRNTIRDIGYTKEEYGFSADKCEILVKLDKQSPDIAMGVDAALELKEDSSKDDYDVIGAGDQGIMFGYASDETENYMPLAIDLSHKLARKLDEIRHNGVLKYLRPDGKSQVTVEYNEDNSVKRIEAIVVSAQHDPDIEISDLRKDIKKYVIDTVVPQNLMDENTKIYINPTGRFVCGGPMGDSGITGRKLIVDTYGGYSAHGGGAFSGKDPTKVDRSASYYIRYIAKNIVVAGIAKKAEIQVAYAIGKAHPVSINVDTFNTGIFPEQKIVDIIKKVFDLRPKAMIDNLNLRQPIFSGTTNYGHFGKEGFSWEKLDKVEEIKKYFV